MQNLTKTDEVTEAENARRENTAEYEKNLHSSYRVVNLPFLMTLNDP